MPYRLFLSVSLLPCHMVLGFWCIMIGVICQFTLSVQDIIQELAPEQLQQAASEAPDVAATPDTASVKAAVPPEASSSVIAPDEQLAAALASSNTSNVQVLHPGVLGSSSVRVDRFEEAAMITVRAAVRITPCTGTDDNACFPVLKSDPSLDVAAAFASSVAAQAALSCSKCDPLPLCHFHLLPCHSCDAFIAKRALTETVWLFLHVRFVKTPRASAGSCLILPAQ